MICPECYSEVAHKLDCSLGSITLNDSDEFLKCDWCKDPIENAETSYMCLDCMEGGHLVCGFRHDYDVHGEGYEDVVGVPV